MTLTHSVHDEDSAKIRCHVFMAESLAANEIGESLVQLIAKRFTFVYQPPECPPEITHGFKGTNGLAFVCIWPHHFNNHLIDKTAEHVHDSLVFAINAQGILSDLDAAARKHFVPLWPLF